MKVKFFPFLISCLLLLALLLLVHLSGVSSARSNGFLEKIDKMVENEKIISEKLAEVEGIFKIVRSRVYRRTGMYGRER